MSINAETSYISVHLCTPNKQAEKLRFRISIAAGRWENVGGEAIYTCTVYIFSSFSVSRPLKLFAMGSATTPPWSQVIMTYPKSLDYFPKTLKRDVPILLQS